MPEQFVVCEALEPRRLFASGDLDLAFGGGDGMSTFSTQPGSQLDRGMFVDIDSLGRIIVGGRTQANLNFGTNVDIFVARFDANGVLDTSFGGGSGFITRNFITSDVPVDMLVQPDNKILVAARTGNASNPAGWSVLRLTDTGANDTSFDGDGVASYDFGSESIVKMGLQPDGKIVSVGTANHNTSGTKATIVRMNSNGSLDSGFATGGVGIVEFITTAINEFYDIAFDGSRIVVTGLTQVGVSTAPAQVGVARFLSNGMLDGSFDGDGKQIISGSTHLMAHSVAVDASSRVVLANMPWPERPSLAYNPLHIYRLTESGQADLSFNAAGPNPGRIELADATVFHTDVAEMMVQPDQKIIFGGAYSGTGGNAMLLVRLNPDGTRDASFGGGDGVSMLTPSSPRVNVAGDFVFDSQKRIIMSGLEVISNGVDFDATLVRVQNDVITPASVAGGRLLIRGTGGADLINLSTSGSNVIVGVNGVSHPFPAASFAWVDVESLTGADTLNINSGFHVFDENAGENSSNLAINVVNGASVSFKAPQRLGGLNVAAGGSASMFADGANQLTTDTLLVDPAGRLNLNDNDLVVNNGTFGDLQALVVQGFGNTTGITSGTSDGSQILALFDNAMVGVTEWPIGSGQSVAAGAIIGKYAWFGDVNLDGVVNDGDYGIVDAGYQQSPPAGIEWISGDANLDGMVNDSDYGMVDAAYGRGSPDPLIDPSLLRRRRDAYPAGSIDAIFIA